jgi:hypothetical protein
MVPGSLVPSTDVQFSDVIRVETHCLPLLSLAGSNRTFFPKIVGQSESPYLNSSAEPCLDYCWHIKISKLLYNATKCKQMLAIMPLLLEGRNETRYPLCHGDDRNFSRYGSLVYFDQSPSDAKPSDPLNPENALKDDAITARDL